MWSLKGLGARSVSNAWRKHLALAGDHDWTNLRHYQPSNDPTGYTTLWYLLTFIHLLHHRFPPFSNQIYFFNICCTILYHTILQISPVTWLSQCLLAEANLLATAVRDSKDCATGIFIYIILFFTNIWYPRLVLWLWQLAESMWLQAPIKKPIYVIYENDLLEMEFMWHRALMHLCIVSSPFCITSLFL